MVCELNYKGYVCLGLLLGGGGFGFLKICEDNMCMLEYQYGIVRNNIIVNCLKDVGIYFNKVMDTKFYNNILFNMIGIDVWFIVFMVDI